MIKWESREDTEVFAGKLAVQKRMSVWINSSRPISCLFSTGTTSAFQLELSIWSYFLFTRLKS